MKHNGYVDKCTSFERSNYKKKKQRKVESNDTHVANVIERLEKLYTLKNFYKITWSEQFYMQEKYFSNFMNRTFQALCKACDATTLGVDLFSEER